MSKVVWKLIAGLGLFLMASAWAHGGWHGHGNWHRHGGASTFYFYPGNYFPYYNTYRNYPSYYPYPATYPTDINSCPLVPSYYDAYGNWIPPTRVCPR